MQHGQAQTIVRMGAHLYSEGLLFDEALLLCQCALHQYPALAEDEQAGWFVEDALKTTQEARYARFADDPAYRRLFCTHATAP